MQKTNFKTRLLALLTAAFMLVMCVPFAAFAEDAAVVTVTFNKGNEYHGDDWTPYLTKNLCATDNVVKAPDLPDGYYWQSNVGTKDLKAKELLTYDDVKAAGENVGYSPAQVKPETTPIEVSFFDGFGKLIKTKTLTATTDSVEEPAATRVEYDTDKYEFHGDWATTFNNPVATNMVTSFDYNTLQFFATTDDKGVARVYLYPVLTEKKATEPEVKKNSVTVNINVDADKGYLTEDGASYKSVSGLPVEGKISLLTADGKSKIVTAKEGYKFTGWTWSGNGDGTLDADAIEFMYTDSAFFYQGVGSVTLTAQFEKVKTEPEVKKNSVTVNINVDADKGYLTEDGASYKSVSGLPVEGKISLLTADGKSKIVTAKEGYKFTGWTWSGNGDGILDADAIEFMYTDSVFFYQGVGNVTLTAQFEKVETEPEETKKTVSVTITTNNEQGIFPDYDGQEVIHFDNLDPDTDQQFELPKVEAKPGYEFIGWHVNGNEVSAWDADAKTFGITGLAHFEKGSNVGYLTIAAVYKAETERTVEVTFSVDPDKGEFEKNDLYTSPAANVMKLTATEFDGTQYAIPTVKAKAGYKFVGWKGQGADAIAWNAEAKTFGVTGLCFFNGDDATTGYATVEAVFEKVEDKKNDNSSSSSSASSSSNKTTTASNEKQVVKAAAAPANTTKVLPKTGASNVAPLLGGSLAVVALLMGYGVYSLVLRKKD